jgi:hypothetical protein
VRQGAGGELARNSEAQSHQRRIKYSQAAREERFCTLPGEISAVRAVEKSAEAVLCAEQRIVQEG